MITVNDISSENQLFYENLPSLSNIMDAHLSRISQYKFLRELDPMGHKILDPNWYKDIWKQVPVDKDDEKKGTEWACKKVERVSIPLQSVILVKVMTYLFGNGMNFDIVEMNPTEKQNNSYIAFKQRWKLYQFNTGVYNFMKSVESTADGAILIYKNKYGETSYKVFSVANGDEIHPVFDYLGELRLFGRTFTKQDNINKTNTFMEVWDDKYYYLFSTDEDLKDESIEIPSWDENKDFKLFSDKNEGTKYFPVSKTEHGSKKFPIVYCKNINGACWSKVQHLIEKLEVALSQFFENNKTYAFRIMYIQGGFEIQGELRDNAVEPRAILLEDPNSKVGFADGADASGSFKEQLQQTLDLIKMGGFIVMPPTSISGDTSGTAIKILYAPAIEQTINKIHFYNPYIKEIVSIFKDYVSTEDDISTSDMNITKIMPYITPYIPQNDQEVVNNLSVAHGAGYLSSETCQERDPNATPQEAMRIRNEKKEEAEIERNSIVSSSSNSSSSDKNGIVDEEDTLDSGAMNASNLQKKALSKNSKK